MMLLTDFGIPPENEMTVIATNPEEIAILSKLAIAFAMEHGADKSRANTYGLITEELGSLFENHGFNDKKPHRYNFRLVVKNDDLIIRVRDDYKPFNIVEYYHAAKNKASEQELSIILNKAKNVQYSTTFGSNSLIIHV